MANSRLFICKIQVCNIVVTCRYETQAHNSETQQIARNTNEQNHSPERLLGFSLWEALRLLRWCSDLTGPVVHRCTPRPLKKLEVLARGSQSTHWDLLHGQRTLYDLHLGPWKSRIPVLSATKHLQSIPGRWDLAGMIFTEMLETSIRPGLVTQNAFLSVPRRLEIAGDEGNKA